MSVIYKTLKKIRTQAISDAGRAMGPGVTPRGEPGRKKRAYLVFAAVFVSINMVLAVGILFGLGRFNSTEGKPAPAIENEAGLPGSEMSAAGSDQRIVIRKTIPAEAAPSSNGAKFLPATPDADRLQDFEAQAVAAEATPRMMEPVATAADIPIKEKKVSPEETGLPESKPGPLPALKPIRSRSAPRTAAATRFEPKPDSQRVRAARIHRENAEKSLKLSRLVREIQAAMRSGNVVHTRQLMDQLEAIQGKDNFYVLKLKAFWCIQNQDYESAYPLLESVIAKNARDLEAGLNLAVCEIKTSRYHDAHRRLTDLMEFYPENYQVSDMLHQVKKYIGEP